VDKSDKIEAIYVKDETKCQITNGSSLMYPITTF